MSEVDNFPRYKMDVDIGEREHFEFLTLAQAAKRLTADFVRVEFGDEVLIAPDEFRPMTDDDKRKIRENAPDLSD